MSEAVTRVVVGKITGVEPKGEWMQVSVTEEGKQYPVKSSTKREEIKRAVIELMATGATVKVQIGEKPSTKINPHNNEPYTDRYLNEIAVAGTGDVSSAPPQTGATGTATAGAQQQTGNGYIDAQTKEIHIMRQSAADRVIQMVAAGMLAPDSSPAVLVAAAEMWVGYYMHGPTRFGVQAFNTEQPEEKVPEATEEQQALATGDPGPSGQGAYSDDDIPF